MSKIKKLNVTNFLGLEELGLDCSKVNLIKGPKGSGKSSIIEAIEKTFTNKNRRSEVVRHGTDEATLYLELDDGLSVDRRIRTEKADYLKIRKQEEAVPSTEKFLRSLINGDIFRPLDWVNMNIKEQTKSILSMLEIGWHKENIVNWFGELPSNIDYDQHILQILKAIELKYYKDREEVNRDIRELKTQIKVILDELPAEYNGEKWRDLKVQEYYNKVSEAQKINQYIESAKALQENFNNKVDSIKAAAESEKSKIKLKYNQQRQDTKDLIELAKNRVEKAKEFISNSNEKVNIELSKLDNELEAEYQVLVQKYTEKKDLRKKEILLQVDEQKDLISLNESKIAAKEQELFGLNELEDHECSAVDEKGLNSIETERVKLGKAADYLKNNKLLEIEPLQKQADEVAEMQSYLREWDRMVDIRDNKLAAKDGCERDLSALFAARNIVKEEYKLKFYASLIALIITFVIFSSLMLIAYFIYR